MRVSLGIGCDRHTPLETLGHAVAQALALGGASLGDVVSVASITLKADEPGLLALGRLHGWAIRFYPPEQLAEVAVPNPSETVRKHTGTPSVSEAAALLAAGTPTGTSLVVEKHRFKDGGGKNATVSVARFTAQPVTPFISTHTTPRSLTP
jgi:cobalamin biosynthesis protein CbiG